ncbi:MAG: hypothetical protein FD123_1762 [Bacteroidetes bacterium]|nr:MAG: hypothetical protein FD123_1762 [Bacteroidota bacterium]
MDFNTSPELQEYLDSNEKLIWTGQPKKGIVFRTADIFLIPFSLLWCGFAIFWFTKTLASGAPFFFIIFGLAFVIVGLIFVFGRFIIDAKQREYIFYGLTNDRIIIKSGIYRKSIQSLNIRTLSDIEYDEKSDGSGTINIGPKNPMMMWGNGMNWWPGVKATPSLDLIQDVRKVYNKILEIQKAK